ncbi:hypothetical protein ACXZ66_10600 [Corynebacterium sp. S7]
MGTTLSTPRIIASAVASLCVATGLVACAPQSPSSPSSAPPSASAPVPTMQPIASTHGAPTTTLPPEANCEWTPIEQVEPGQLGALYCDGSWANLGLAQTDGLYFVRYINQQWEVVPHVGTTWTGFPCYDVEYWKEQGAPQAITDRMLVCDVIS